MYHHLQILHQTPSQHSQLVSYVIIFSIKEPCKCSKFLGLLTAELNSGGDEEESGYTATKTQCTLWPCALAKMIKKFFLWTLMERCSECGN